jgi:hypothetical protein
MTTPPPASDPAQVLPFPEINIVLNDNRPRIEIAGTEHPLTGQDLVEMREDARKRIAQTATALGRPVRATAYEAGRTWSLIVHPDGTIQDGPRSPATAPKPRGGVFRRRPR